MSKAPDIFGDAIASLIEWNARPFFVQVGGFDGVSFDPLRRHIVEQGLSGLIIEPIPQYFEKLTTLYAGSSGVTAVNCAIGEEDGERKIWRFDPKAIERGLLPPHLAGMSSFKMEEMLSEKGVLGVSSPDAETMVVLRSQLQAVTVQCRTLDSLLRERRVERVDILQIDTEGYDYAVLKLFDFPRFKPAIVQYEHQHLSPADGAAAEALLRSHGYRVQRGECDTLAVRAKAQSVGQAQGLRDLAVSLFAGGRSKDALMLLDHLEALQPGDPETLQQHVRILGAQGQPLKALERLVVLKSVAIDTEALVREIRAQMPAAIKCFNDHLAAGQIEQAEKYAAGLATLIPGNAALQNSALCCNVELGRKEPAEKFAAALFAIDRTHALARTVLADTGAWVAKSAA